MKILIISDALVSGGAEWFSLRQWEALTQKGHETEFYVLRPDTVEKRITDNFPGFSYVSLPVWLVFLLVQMDRVINKVFGNPVLLDKANGFRLKRYIKELNPDILHSHLLNTDEVVMNANARTLVPHTTTIHGDYIRYIKTGNKPKIKKAEKLLRYLSEIILISDEQIQIMEQHYPWAMNKTAKIYNGYPVPEGFQQQKHNETSKPFSYGLIARGIPEKGWEPAIQAFLSLTISNIILELYGESEYLDGLKKKYVDRRIHFKGFTGNPLESIQHLDVGLLPSYYESESLPTTVIEYLIAKKPTIATDAGEVKKMITDHSSGRIAGIVIGKTSPDQMIPALRAAMLRLYEDKQIYTEAKEACLGAYQQFSMDKCINGYISVYQKSYSSKKSDAVLRPMAALI
jgi:glycosyltransferase involved in cell wall biosynthesis